MCGGGTRDREPIQVASKSVERQFSTGGNFVPQETFGNGDIFGCQGGDRVLLAFSEYSPRNL